MRLLDLPHGLDQMLDAPDWGSIDRVLASWTWTLLETQRRNPNMFSAEETYEQIGTLVSAAAARELELQDQLRWKSEARAEYYAERRSARA